MHVLLVLVLAVAGNDAAIRAAACGKAKCTIAERYPTSDSALEVVGLTGLVQRKADAPDDCIPVAYYAVRTSGGKLSTEHIFDAKTECSYGMGGGDEEVAVSGTSLTYTMNGGSAWSWVLTDTWSLTPKIAKVVTSHSGFWKLGSNASDETIDHVKGLGKIDWYAPMCGKKEGDDVSIADTGQPGSHHYVSIPHRASPSDTAWREIDATGNNGFVYFGKPAATGAAHFRVAWLSKQSLTVEVTDPHWVTGRDSWVHGDHLELWLGGKLESYTTPCLEPNTNVVQLGINADGTVVQGYGKGMPQQKVTVIADSPTVKRFLIEFAAVPESLTVSYSDSDDGSKQKRIIGTSTIKYGDGHSLGATDYDPTRSRD